MNHAQANRILDAIKGGAQYPLHTINKALEMTGDRLESDEEHGSERMARQIPTQETGCGATQSPRMVARHDS